MDIKVKLFENIKIIINFVGLLIINPFASKKMVIASEINLSLCLTQYYVCIISDVSEVVVVMIYQIHLYMSRQYILVLGSISNMVELGT